MKLLIVGKNSMVIKAFINMYASDHSITGIGKEDNLEKLENTQYDAVIFAAQSADYKKDIITEDLNYVNVVLLQKTLELIPADKFIYFSTGSVYKTREDGIYSDRSAVIDKTDNPYIFTKLKGEEILSAYKNKFKGIYVLRPFYMYGKGQKDTMLVTSLYKRILNGEDITIYGADGLIFNPVYADDVAKLLQHLLISGPAGHKIYNVAGSEIAGLKEVIDYIGQILKINATVKVKDTSASKMIAEVNIPGWKAETGWKEGLHKMFA